jgi:glycine cleavage system transcriptional repressor
MQQYLALTAIAPQNSPVLYHIAEICGQYNCQIVESRFSHSGQHQIMMMYISGSWNNIAKIESPILSLGNQEGMLLKLTRTEIQGAQPTFLPYVVHITATSSSQTLSHVLSFFANNQVNVHDLNVQQYTANRTQAQMQTIAMTVLLPADTHLAELRENFILFCDEYNLDAIFEPDRL